MNQATAIIAEFAGAILHTAEILHLKKLVLPCFPLDQEQCAIVAELPGLPPSLKKKLKQPEVQFTLADCSKLFLALAPSLPGEDRALQMDRLAIAQVMFSWINDTIDGMAPPRDAVKKTTKKDLLYQFKITLCGVEPPVWRRIQITDCTLEKLHGHIQTAMGWFNCHLHQYIIKGQYYGIPRLLEDGFDPMGSIRLIDSTKTRISKIVPKSGSRFTFRYEYDFGDSWEHDILFEGNPPINPKAKYPLCLEGERACPPEDVGGIPGYEEFRKAIKNPKHPEHKNYTDWIGRKFEPEKFDAKQATKDMRKGLPDWRDRV